MIKQLCDVTCSHWLKMELHFSFEREKKRERKRERKRKSLPLDWVFLYLTYSFQIAGFFLFFLFLPFSMALDIKRKQKVLFPLTQRTRTASTWIKKDCQWIEHMGNLNYSWLIKLLTLLCVQVSMSLPFTWIHGLVLYFIAFSPFSLSKALSFSLSLFQKVLP